jgi:hypothetical protein
MNEAVAIGLILIGISCLVLAWSKRNDPNPPSDGGGGSGESDSDIVIFICTSSGAD